MSGIDDQSKHVANAGLLRPPVIFLLAGVIGFVAHQLHPLHLPFQKHGIPVGAALLLLSIGLLLYTLHTFRKAQTPFPGNQAVKHLIADGPFRFSRNPAYVAFSGITLAAAFASNSLWIVLTLVGAISTMNWIVIPREEHYLAKMFGERYGVYRQSVRRWF